MSDDENENRPGPTNDPETLNWRALDALNGSAFQDGSLFVDTICDLLLSDAEISLDVRLELASAIKRGRSGYRSTEYNSDGIPKPRLVAEGFPAAKMRRAVSDRHRWFDAGEAVFDAREDGLTGDEAILAAGKKFRLGFEAMRKSAIPYYKEFRSLIESGTGWLNLDSAVAPVFPELILEMNSEDEEIREYALDMISDMLKSHYIWATADMAVNGLEAPRAMNDREW